MKRSHLGGIAALALFSMISLSSSATTASAAPYIAFEFSDGSNGITVTDTFMQSFTAHRSHCGGQLGSEMESWTRSRHHRLV